jgi:hypothetical protein
MLDDFSKNFGWETSQRRKVRQEVPLLVLKELDSSLKSSYLRFEVSNFAIEHFYRGFLEAILFCGWKVVWMRVL